MHATVIYASIAIFLADLMSLYHALIIGSGDIVGGNKKLILGLVWTLILHYQINLGLGLDGDKSKNEKMSAKKALLGYINVSVI